MTLPEKTLESDALSSIDKAMGMEWIISNGLGGYASSTVLGINSRKYHGLLVASLNPPVDRRVLLAKLDEEIHIGDEIFPLSSNEFRNCIYPQGHQFLQKFSLAPLPSYLFKAREVHLQKEIVMPHEKNVTVVAYDVLNPYEEQLSIRISPLVSFRHFHDVTNKDEMADGFIQKPFEKGLIIRQPISNCTVMISLDHGKYCADKGKWVKEVYFRIDSSRGESCLDDCFNPGWFEFNVAPKEKKRAYVTTVGAISENEARSLLLSIQDKTGGVAAIFNQELERRKGLLKSFHELYKDMKIEDWLKWLILAVDSFLVKRESTKMKSMIAGYHWFEDWGRDSLISLPGLTLVTGRFEDAKEILLTFERYINKGLIPNRFPDRTGDSPVFNSVDATLWFFNSILQYLKYTYDFDYVRKKLWDSLQSIIEHLIRGTLFDIHVEEDGLLAHGPQLTWMDAALNDYFVTPRKGKAVEIQALWFNALKIMELLASRFNQKDEARDYSILAEKARMNFNEKFWNEDESYLFDVIGKQKTDSSMRPNQVFAVALDFSMLDKARQKNIVEYVWKKLWGTYGLKTLSNDDPGYISKYTGDWAQRTKAYHNGTVWAWLLGPFATAFLKVHNHDEYWRTFVFKEFLRPLFKEKLFKAGLGSIGEIFDADKPHSSRGCIAQAWSVAEPLRAFLQDVSLRRPPHERQVLEIIG